MILLFLLLFRLGVAQSWAGVPSKHLPDFPPCDPVSEPLKSLGEGASSELNGELTGPFCSRWNPDFAFNHHQCCSPLPSRGRRRKHSACSPVRVSHGFCSEMTLQQKQYIESTHSGKLGDALELLTEEMGRHGEQAFCTVNNGFLAQGRPILPSSQNRILIQSPERCTNFGTDAMVGMLEWAGREVSRNFSAGEFSQSRVLIGDISGPRGGCLFGVSGKKRHASHTTGQDADVGFLTVLPHQASPSRFHTQLDLVKNWWFLKRIFKNPFACIKVIFLDRRQIARLSRVVGQDPEWKQYHRFIRHMPGHSNHFHIRVGMGPGPVGCTANAQPELELEDDEDLNEATELSILDELDQLKTGQSSKVEE